MKKIFYLVSNYSPFLIFILFVLLWYFKDLNGGSIFSYNDRIPFPASVKNINSLINSWQEQTQGVMIPQYFVYPLYQFLTSKALNSNTVLAQNVFFILPMLLSFISMYWFLGKINVASRLSKFLASFAFSVNLGVLGELAGGAPYSLFANSLIPVITYYFLLSFVKGKVSIKTPVLLALFIALSFSFSDYILIFLGLAILFAIITNLIKHRVLWRCFISNLLVFSFTLIFLLITFLPLYLRLYLNTDFSLQSEILKSLYKDVSSSYAGFNLWSFISLGGGKFYEQIFGGPKFWGYFSVVTPVTAFLGCLISKKERRSWVYACIFTVLLLIVFIVLTQKGVVLKFYQFLPLLFRFRNIARLVLLLSFVLSILMAFFWEYTLDFLRRKWIIFIVSATWFFVYLISIYPFSFGHILNAQKAVPDYYTKIQQVISRERAGGFYRTLYFPWDYEVQKRVLWDDAYVNGLLLGYGQFYRDYYNYFLGDLYEYAGSGNKEAFVSGLKFSRTGIVVVDKNRSTNKLGNISGGFVFLTPYLTGDSQKFISLIKETEAFNLLEESKDYAIFKVKNPTQELEFYSGAVDLLSERPDYFFKVLYENKVNLDGSIYNISKYVPGVNVDMSSYEKIESDALILEDYFSPKPREDSWEVAESQVSGVKTLPSGYILSGLSSKKRLTSGTTINFSFSQPDPNTYGRVGLWDVAGNGIWFDLVLREGDNKPLLKTVVKNQNFNYSSNVGVRDAENHLYTIDWGKKTVKFSYDGKVVGDFDTAFDDSFNFQVSGSTQFNINLKNFTAKKTNNTIIWKSSKDLIPISLPAEFQISNNVSGDAIITAKNVPQHFILVYNHPYAEGWRAMIGNQVLKHFHANGIFNGFEVENYKGGDIVIDYPPQELHIFNLSFYAISLLIVVAFTLVFRGGNY